MPACRCFTSRVRTKERLKLNNPVSLHAPSFESSQHGKKEEKQRKKERCAWARSPGCERGAFYSLEFSAHGHCPSDSDLCSGKCVTGGRHKEIDPELAIKSMASILPKRQLL